MWCQSVESTAKISRKLDSFDANALPWHWNCVRCWPSYNCESFCAHEIYQSLVGARQTAGIGSVRGQDHSVRIQQKRRPCDGLEPRLNIYLGVIVPGNLATGPALGDVAKGQRWHRQFGKMAAAQINWTRIMVAFDPNPASPCLQFHDPQPLFLGQCMRGLNVVKAVPQAHYGRSVASRQISGQAVQRVAGVIRWQCSSPRRAIRSDLPRCRSDTHSKR